MLATQATIGTTCHTPRAGVAGLIYIGITEIIGLKQTTFTFSRFTLLLSHVLSQTAAYVSFILWGADFFPMVYKIPSKNVMPAQAHPGCSTGARILFRCEIMWTGTAFPWTGTNTACRSFLQFSRDFSHYVVLRHSVRRNVLKSVMRVQSCCFLQKTNWFESPFPTLHATWRPYNAFLVSLYLLLSSWIMCSWGSLKQRRFWRTHVNRKWDLFVNIAAQ